MGVLFSSAFASSCCLGDNASAVFADAIGYRRWRYVRSSGGGIAACRFSTIVAPRRRSPFGAAPGLFVFPTDVIQRYVSSFSSLPPPLYLLAAPALFFGRPRIRWIGFRSCGARSKVGGRRTRQTWRVIGWVFRRESPSLRSIHRAVNTAAVYQVGLYCCDFTAAALTLSPNIGRLARIITVAVAISPPPPSLLARSERHARQAWPGARKPKGDRRLSARRIRRPCDLMTAPRSLAADCRLRTRVVLRVEYRRSANVLVSERFRRHGNSQHLNILAARVRIVFTPIAISAPECSLN